MELSGLDVQNRGGIMDDAKAVHRSGHFHIPVRYGTFNQLPFRFPVFEKPAVGFQVSGDFRCFLRLLTVVDEGAGFVDGGSPAGAQYVSGTKKPSKQRFEDGMPVDRQCDWLVYDL